MESKRRKTKKTSPLTSNERFRKIFILELRHFNGGQGDDFFTNSTMGMFFR